jgi:hypothetical protein
MDPMRTQYDQYQASIVLYDADSGSGLKSAAWHTEKSKTQ